MQRQLPTYFSVATAFILIVSFSCAKDDGVDNNSGGGGSLLIPNGCDNVGYPNWSVSPHLLPYPVGQSYAIGLSHCGGAQHAAGLPDQFAIDIVMDIGTLVTASRKGIIVFVEDSGGDFEPLNNVVVLRDEDGYFLQYQHLTQNGALVEQGQIVYAGDPIGYSGASGNARYPHLHFIATNWDYNRPYGSYSYQSLPITFSNTSANPKSLIQNEVYEALPY